jgi:hypothetical protein
VTTQPEHSSGRPVRVLASWTSLHLYAGVQLRAHVEPAQGSAVITVEGQPNGATLFIPREQLRALGEVVTKALAVLDAYVPPIVIDATPDTDTDTDSTDTDSASASDTAV